MCVNRRDQTDSTVSEYNIYHATFQNETLYASDGSVIASAGSFPVDVDQLTTVRDSESIGRHAWGYAANVNNGTPELVWDEYPEERYWEHSAHYAKYENGSWTVNKITDTGDTPGARSGAYSLGMDLDKTTDGTVYLSTGSHNHSKIQRWETDDSGQTWDWEDWTNPNSDNFRPIVPKNRHPEMPVLWLHGNFVDYFDGRYDVVPRGGYHASNSPPIGNPTAYGKFALENGQDQTVPSVSDVSTADFDTDGYVVSWDASDDDLYDNLRGLSSDNLQYVTTYAGVWENRLVLSFDGITSSGTIGAWIKPQQAVYESVSSGDSITITLPVDMEMDDGTSMVVKVLQDTGSDITLRAGSGGDPPFERETTWTVRNQD
jgi:hypothetical protein